jgi:hypothetical protein
MSVGREPQVHVEKVMTAAERRQTFSLGRELYDLRT